MNIKFHIKQQMADRHAPIAYNSIARVISGEYSPRFGIVKELADITKSKVEYWVDPDCVAERQLVVGKLAVRLGMDYFIGRGRPRKVKIKPKGRK